MRCEGCRNDVTYWANSAELSIFRIYVTNNNIVTSIWQQYQYDNNNLPQYASEQYKATPKQCI